VSIRRGSILKTEVFALDQLLAKRIESRRSYLEFVRVPAMSAGVYVLPAGAPDPQQPHHQDEIYYVVRGQAKMRLVHKDRAKADQDRSVGEGSVIFVEAGLEHRFFDVEEELVVLVVFAPEESS
jgi:mannose-6-phosphate isomerase-like protein (cupin superfamily)